MVKPAGFQAIQGMILAVERSAVFWCVAGGVTLITCGLLMLGSAVLGDAYERRRRRFEKVAPTRAGVRRVDRSTSFDPQPMISRWYRRMALVLVPVGIVSLIVAGVVALLS